MAKRKRGAKSAAVRELLDENPDMTAKEVVARLAARRLRINPHIVYTIRSTMKAKGMQKRRSAAARNTWAANPVELVVKVKALSSAAGGIRNLKQLVDALAD